MVDITRATWSPARRGQPAASLLHPRVASPIDRNSPGQSKGLSCDGEHPMSRPHLPTPMGQNLTIFCIPYQKIGCFTNYSLPPYLIWNTPLETWLSIGSVHLRFWGPLLEALNNLGESDLWIGSFPPLADRSESARHPNRHPSYDHWRNYHSPWVDAATQQCCSRNLPVDRRKWCAYRDAYQTSKIIKEFLWRLSPPSRWF